ncbi:RNA polymerase sigma factor [uncultured Aquimarina sp.]|uniref:RNA polymerase sigma factor n=1 Tax=uncultured Aquimarina sp. TaxID=575652 RepID=UPI00261C1916|nr:RNA polymerase sigma factor [uncultured Aquimarina sp.]
MKKPFNIENYSDSDDLELIKEALNGDHKSLNKLIVDHQQYIFNIALKMINGIADAEDVTQEVLIKLVTNLSKYDSTKARFRTWLYRITFNHILNVKKQKYEMMVTSFDNFFDFIDSAPELELSEKEEKEMQALVEESKISCMAGMIMCLDREQRLTYIVGELFEIDHNLAGEIFEISPSTFRKRLSRARKNLYDWMNNRCGLVNKDNPCRCSKKTKGFIEKGWVTEDLKWNSDYKKKIFELSEEKVDIVLLERDDVYAKIHRDHPFKNHNKSGLALEAILQSKIINSTFKLDN